MRNLLLLVTLLAAGPTRAPLTPLHSLAEVEQLKHSGTPTLIHFWATWCAACVAELPRQVALARRAHEQGVSVVFVDVDMDPQRQTALDWLTKLDALTVATHVRLTDDPPTDQVTPLFEADWHGSLPATFVYDACGNRVGERIGMAPGELGNALLTAASAPSARHCAKP